MAKLNITRNEGESEADFRRRYHREWEIQDRRARGIGPKIKPEGPCALDGCDAPAEVRGMCGRHYRADRVRKRAQAGKRSPGKRAHPLYSVWFERKQRGSLCVEWTADFWAFVNAIGARPSEKHLLRRPDASRPYSATNWEWIDALKRLPGETRKAFNARKWASRREREPEYERRRFLRRKYGITVEDYEAMLQAQGGVCATCQQPETAVHHDTQTVKSLAVDHCHETGRVRGLLCWHCNSVLGKVGDSIKTLETMIAYLRRSQACGLQPRQQ